MAIILVTTQLSKKLPWDNPETVLYVRALYIFSNLVIAAIYLYVMNKINAKKGM